MMLLALRINVGACNVATTVNNKHYRVLVGTYHKLRMIDECILEYG